MSAAGYSNRPLDDRHFGVTAGLPAHWTRSEKVPAGERWIHQIKFDGYRVQLHIHNDDIKNRSKSGEAAQLLSSLGRAFPAQAILRRLVLGVSVTDGLSDALSLRVPALWQAGRQLLRVAWPAHRNDRSKNDDSSYQCLHAIPLGFPGEAKCKHADASPQAGPTIAISFGRVGRIADLLAVPDTIGISAG
jgi:hypothetical protein